MKLLVCISKTPETTAPIAFENNNTTFKTDGVKYILNPYDEWYALVRAIELKEQAGGTVTVINVGTSENDTVIKKALAIGADNAVRINVSPEDAYCAAIQIISHAKSEEYDLIFLGKETIDYNGSELGAMVAEGLDMPFISYVEDMKIEGNSASLHRDIEGGKELIKLETPFVLSAAKGLAEQRIPNMRGIMMAKRKPFLVVEPSEVESLVNIASYQIPEKKAGCKMIDPDNIDELVRLLHEEAKVI